VGGGGSVAASRRFSGVRDIPGYGTE